MTKPKPPDLSHIEPDLRPLAVPIADLTLDPRQARDHDERSIAEIKDSLRLGQKMPIFVQRDGMIVAAGNGRVVAALELGWTHLAAVVSDDPEAAIREYAIRDNRSAEFARWRPEVVKTELIDLGIAPEAIGWKAEEWTGLFDIGVGGGSTKTRQDAEPQTDRAAELREKWGVEPGQLWALGEHRLLCGDSTKAKDVGRVMGGERAALCLTDPPYGIGLDYATHDDSEDALKLLARRWLPIAREHSDAVVFTPGVTRQWFYPEPNWVMCWFYGGGQLRSPWGFNCWQPILAYGKDPSLAHGRGCRPDAVDMNTPANAQDIDHPCPKPLALWLWLIERCSFGEHDLVLDVFSGSGTTIIACEQLGRRCRAIEISPGYVAVALQRWADATGKTPTLAP